MAKPLPNHKLYTFKIMNQQSTLRSALRQLEEEVETAVANRHNYPMWPLTGDGFTDTYEELYHQPIREQYYRQTKVLIRLLRILREIG